MAFSVDQVLDLLDSSGELEIEEDPLPHESDSDCEKPLPYNSWRVPSQLTVKIVTLHMKSV